MVLCSGCFDGIHSGHVAYLRAAAQLATGEALYVAVAPDEYMRRVKGREPRWGAVDRRDAVRAINQVARAFVHDTQSIAKDIRERQPRALIKGVDWAGKLPQDVIDACRAVGCLIVYVDTERKHTSDV